MLHPAQTGTKTEASLNYGRAGDEVHPDYEDEQYDKFLSIPFVENDENDEESMLRRMTSTRLSKFVGCGILLTVVAALATALAYYMKDNNSVSTDDPPVTKVCYENPSCLNVSIYHIYDSNGFTNNTGWSPNSYSTNSCCNICLPGMNSTVCFPTSDSVESYRDLWTSEGNKKRKDSRSSVLKNRKRFQANDDVADCQDKTGYDDYDYVMLDQIYFPQWCNALAAGHDPTVSHLQGSLCTDAVTKGVPLLNIHGLWPNYYNGYPQCCKQEGEDSVEPLDPEDVQTEWETYDELQQMWFDPTTDLVNSEGCNCATCYLLNHEWEKHGSCMGVGEVKELYFKAGLEIAEALANHSIVVQNMNGSIVEVGQIVGLYNHTVNVICDPKAEYIPPSAVWTGEGPAPQADEVQVFLEIQSCWDVEIDTFTVQQILDDDEGVLLSGHEQEGAAVSLIVYHALVKKAKGGSAGGGVSVVHSLRDWRESLSTQYTHSTVIDVATFYGMNCTAAKPSSITTPCENKYVYVSNYNT